MEKTLKKHTKTNILLFSADIHTYKLTFVSFFYVFFAPSPKEMAQKVSKISGEFFTRGNGLKNEIKLLKKHNMVKNHFLTNIVKKASLIASAVS